MATINRFTISLLYLVADAVAQQTTTQPPPPPTSTSASTTSLSQSPTSAAPSTTSSAPPSNSGGGSSSPLLFFVALGFGVVFTNLWIIVGVKYCFRYNARNRALRNGEDSDPVALDNMPTRPHRRRREKKLMTMDEVNERFPLSKYKNWVASRASEGLPTTGGVAVASPPSRPASIKETDKAAEIEAQPEAASTAAAAAKGEPAGERTSVGASSVEKDTPSPNVEHFALKEVQTTDSNVDTHGSPRGDDDDDDDDEHIHTALPPELLGNPGDSCAICIDTLEPDDDIRGLTCGHAFHAGCLDPWLTSRRACCPLCKADYYVPKPRPEGEAADPAGRRGRGAPQSPQPAWTGLRSSRMVLPGRFLIAGYPGDGVNYNPRESRRDMRERRATLAAAAVASGANDAPAHVTPEDAADPAASRRWRTRISNPFRAVHLPTFGRPRATSAAAAEPSPSQLESGVAAR